MSDQSQGDGWWQASDGRWYPPQPTAPVPPAGPPMGGPPMMGPPAQPMMGQPGPPMTGPPGPPAARGGSTPLIIGIVVLVLLLISAGVAFALTRVKTDVVGVPPLVSSTTTTTTAGKAGKTTTTTDEPGRTTTTKKKSSSTTAPDDETTTTRRTPRTTAGRTEDPVPDTFPVPADTSAAIAAAGLPELTSEGDIVHYHAHVDLRINGTDVAIAEQIGIGRSTISPVHTHDTSGVVHIEALEEDEFTLGQFFTEWDLALDQSCVATYCADDSHELRVAVNGVELEPGEDPADVVFAKHDEIAIWFGPVGTDVSFPPDYEFDPGL